MPFFQWLGTTLLYAFILLGFIAVFGPYINNDKK